MKLSIHYKVLFKFISTLLISFLHLICHAVWLFCSLHVGKLSISLNSVLSEILLNSLLSQIGFFFFLFVFPFGQCFSCATNAVFCLLDRL